MRVPVLEYSEYRSIAEELDVVAFEATGLAAAVIRAVTGGTVTHVGLTLWDRASDVLELAESRELRGGRRVLLSRELERAGHALIYRAPALAAADPGRRAAARRWLVRAMGTPYDYLGLLVFVGLRRPRPDGLRHDGRVCSALVDQALAVAGVDVLPGAARRTSPARLVAAPGLELLCRVDAVSLA